MNYIEPELKVLLIRLEIRDEDGNLIRVEEHAPEQRDSADSGSDNG